MKVKQLTETNSLVPTYTGPLSKATNLFVYLLFGNDRLNYTLTLKKSVGTLNATSGYYNEGSCLYSMQTNESNFAVGATLFLSNSSEKSQRTSVL